MFPGGPAARLDPLDEFADVVARWIEAEAQGDTATLRALLHDDFQGDGPRGFVLTKQQWLDRYDTGDLVNQAFDWEDAELRVFDDSAVVMGVQVQKASYQGVDCSGRYRGTLVAVRRDGHWSIVNLQLGHLEEPA
jgi:Domain of unknown function (DUF4440)